MDVTLTLISKKPIIRRLNGMVLCKHAILNLTELTMGSCYPLPAVLDTPTGSWPRRVRNRRRRLHGGAFDRFLRAGAVAVKTN